MIRSLMLSTVAAIGLAACANGQLTTSADTAIMAAFATAEGALTAYEATPNPSQAVVTKAGTFLATAQNALTAYQGQPTDATKAAAAAAVAALTTYLLTAAPGNGVTPASA